QSSYVSNLTFTLDFNFLYIKEILSSVRGSQTKLIGNDNSCANLKVFSSQYSKPTSDSAKGGTNTTIERCEIKGLFRRSINKVESVLFKILSDFSPTIFSTIDVALG